MSMASKRTIGDFLSVERSKQPHPKKRKVQKKEVKARSEIVETKNEAIVAQETDEPADLDIEFLRDFDLDPTYGPAIGISRLERYERAVKLGDSPDPMIKALIESHKDDQDYLRYTESIWYEYRTKL